MLLSPRNFKYRKQQKGKSINRISVKSKNTKNLIFGEIGLKSIESGRLTAKQMQSVRQVINKKIKKIGRLKINVFPHTPVSKKPVEVRMGKGKGNVDHHIFKVKAGMIIYEIETKFASISIKALKLAQRRLPFKTKIIYN
jgi:large subunit ribosomal protein L16|tara:strand:+ start:2086 stop:2505 length:420 start_codon:yes stop_codon:yes gene_type:complete